MSVQVIHGDALQVLPTLADASVDLILTDPPYFNVKIDQSWDRQWKNAAAYLAWLDAVAAECAAWAREQGDNPLMRIALCGYEGEHDMPGWTEHAWRANGGYAHSTGKGRDNANRERIWFSPHCLGAARPGLFDQLMEAAD